VKYELLCLIAAILDSIALLGLAAESAL